MNVIGIDLGANGGICKINSNRSVVFLEPMPTVGSKVSTDDLLKLMIKLNEPKNTFVFMEKVAAFPGQSSKSMFSYGHHVGSVETIMKALSIPFEMVPPKMWQKQMFVGTEASQSTKVRALIAARRLTPDIDFLASARCKKPHEGMVDALLIATYGSRKFAVVSG